MSDTPQTPVPAGWYADPSVTGQVRWWDGTAWTAHVGVPASPPPQAPLTAPQPAFDVESPTLSEPGTTASWVLATTPLWLGVGELLALLASGDLLTGVFTLNLTGGVVAVACGVVLAIVVIAAAMRDSSQLRRAGYERAPSAGWILLTPLAYLIVRTVRVHNRAGRGAAPLVFYLVAGLALGLTVSTAALALPAYLAQHGGTADAANATSFATGVARGLGQSGGTFEVTCTPFSMPTTTPISIICDATDGRGTDHKMVIEVDPPSMTGADPRFRLVSVSPPITR